MRSSGVRRLAAAFMRGARSTHQHSGTDTRPPYNRPRTGASPRDEKPPHARGYAFSKQARGLSAFCINTPYNKKALVGGGATDKGLCPITLFPFDTDLEETALQVNAFERRIVNGDRD